jgi:hypothetical protein
MTAVLGILNKQAVAIAANSAVTVIRQEDKHWLIKKGGLTIPSTDIFVK